MQNETVIKLLKEKPLTTEKEVVHMNTNIIFDKNYKSNIDSIINNVSTVSDLNINGQANINTIYTNNISSNNIIINANTINITSDNYQINGMINQEYTNLYTIIDKNIYISCPSNIDGVGIQISGLNNNGYIIFDQSTNAYLLNTPNNNSPNKILTNINNNYYIQAENQLNIPNDNYIFIRINDYGIIYNTDKILDKYIQLDTSYRLNKNTYLGKIILNKKNEYVYDNKNFITKQYIFRQRVNIDRFDIELLDPYFNTIDMNNLDYSLTLELGYLI